MKAIVIGGSGFVGSHVADALTEAGHLVTVFDSAPSPYLRSEQAFVLGDVQDADALAGAVEGHDVVYHFAGIADIFESRSKPVDTAYVNVAGTVNALEAARRANVERFVFASSIYVYSDAGSFYRVSKQACEAYVEEYEREFGLPYTILRYGTLFGRRASDSNSVHRYLRQALVERRLTAYGSGEEPREYIHVEDAAGLSVRILEPEFRNEHVVLTGHHQLRFGELLKLIQEMVGPDVEIDLQKPEAGKAPPPWAGHYAITPYRFKPRLARKLVSELYIDMGQGLLDCLQEIHEELEQSPAQ